MKRLQITGRLAEDAKVKELEGGKFVLEANVYCDDSRNTSHIVQVTQFFKESPKNADLFKKGSIISAFGENKVNAWTTKEGEPRATEVLYADRFHVESVHQPKEQVKEG